MDCVVRWEISLSGNFKAYVRQTPDISDIGIIYHGRKVNYRSPWIIHATDISSE